MGETSFLVHSPYYFSVGILCGLENNGLDKRCSCPEAHGPWGCPGLGGRQCQGQWGICPAWAWAQRRADGVPSRDRAEVCRSWPEQVTECCVPGRRHALWSANRPWGKIHSKTKNVCHCPSHLPKPKRPCLLKVVKGLFGEISHLYLDPAWESGFPGGSVVKNLPANAGD